MSDANLPIRGKCTWWREVPHAEDQYDVRLKKDEKRVNCSCFVEGKGWQFTAVEVPGDCPDFRHCRYYTKHL